MKNIETGFCEFRQKRGQRPFYCTWEDKGTKYYCYHPFSFLAEACAEKLKKDKCYKA